MFTLPKLSSHLFLLTTVSLFALTCCGEREPAEKVEVKAENSTTTTSTPALPQSGQITTSAHAPRPPVRGIPQADGSRYVPLNPEQQKQLQNAVLVQEARAQAAGLGSGKVTVNKAWNYTGWTVLEMNPNSTIEARFVAVDVTIEGHTRKFDSDDIEIIDPVTGASYGSDPHSVFLTIDGKVQKDPKAIPIAPSPTRMLLIYAYPKATDQFGLSYWRQLLLNKPVDIEPDGWALPFPKAP